MCEACGRNNKLIHVILVDIIKLTSKNECDNGIEFVNLGLVSKATLL